MADFVNYVAEHFYVDHATDEIKALSLEMRKFLDKTKEFINNKTLNYKISKLVSCGSMTEETRVWEMRLRSEDKDDTVHEGQNIDGEYIPVLEFDFLAILSQISETPLFSDSHLGYKIIMVNDVYIEAVKTEEEMIRNVAEMKSSCKCFQITETEDFVRKPECRQGCNECMDHGNLKFSGIIDRKYWFSWRTNNKNNFTFITEKGIIHQKCSTINVQLDLLPAYEVIDTDKQQDTKEKHHNCFLVPKTCIEKEHTKCWRISHCQTEISTLQNTSLSHRNVYRTLKYLLLVLLDICDIKSFHIKNIVLHHIGKCKSNRNVEKCLCETIDELVCCIQKGEMPFWSICGIHMEPFHSDHLYFKRKADFDRSFYSEILRLTKQVIEKKQLDSHETDYKLQTPDGKDIALSEIIGNSIFETANRVIKNELNVGQYLLEMAKLWESNEDFYSNHIEQEEDYEKVRIDPGTVDFSRTIFTESP